MPLMDDVATIDLEQHLARFGLASFRPGQRDVIEAVLAGRDCLCIMPTGGGKSLCYQLPAVAREGLTLVVSPLIALMKDQVDALQGLGIEATFINSSLSSGEMLARMDGMAAGLYKLVYIAPERLRSSLFLEKLRSSRLSLLAVDEAHCISEWGHDFRPDYARIGLVRQRLNFPPTIALTATATPQVREDVVRQLHLREPQTFITGFARTNLHFEVHQAFSEVDKDQTLLDFLRGTPGAGIIYSATRKKCEELAETLRGQLGGRRIGLYHAGLEQDDRRRVQDNFMDDKTPVIVATNAFGMGIDKSDLRFVVHYHIPGSIEAYYQEAGRAGRDGLPSRCLLIYNQRDRRTQEFFIDSAYPPPEIVQAVYDFLREQDVDPIELTLDEIKDRLGLRIRSEGISACEKLLEGAGALERLDSRQNMAGVRIDSDLPTLVDVVPRNATVQRKVIRAVERIVGELRGERVFVNPRHIARECELELSTVTGALRELSKLKSFDYVPPFRGRAVHMLEREKPFDKLDIDFAEQQRRKEAEYAKLDKMIDYALNRGCRQLAILDYFGDPARKKCGLCDNCGGMHADGHGAATVGASEGRTQNGELPGGTASAPQVVQAARIVLSGAARMKGRFGKILLAKMLMGSESAKVTKAGLTRLSTFGLLKMLTEPEVMSVIDALLRLRLLQQVELNPHRPLIHLTPRGEQVMRAEIELPELVELDATLIAKLRPLAPRPGTAAKRAPATIAATTTVPAASANADSALGGAPMNEPAPAPSSVSAASSDDRTAALPPHYWTWRVLTAGISAEECRQIRNIDADTLYDHVLRAGREGRPVEATWLLSSEQLDTLERLMGGRPLAEIRTLAGHLPEGIKFRDVQLYLLSKETKNLRT
jgi:ATP-dependent DNA helicase RecQ